MEKILFSNYSSSFLYVCNIIISRVSSLDLCGFHYKPNTMKHKVETIFHLHMSILHRLLHNSK